MATYHAHKNVGMNHISLSGAFTNQLEYFVEILSNMKPKRWMARTDEYKEAAIFLVYDSLPYITGADLIVD